MTRANRRFPLTAAKFEEVGRLSEEASEKRLLAEQVEQL